MTIQQAISTINGFTNFYAKLDDNKIVIEYYFKGKRKEAGFVSEKDIQLSLGFCGSFTSRFESILNKIHDFKIDWTTETETESKKETKTSNKIGDHHYSSLAERDRLEADDSNWMYTHDL